MRMVAGGNFRLCSRSLLAFLKEVFFSLYEGVCKEQYECTCPVFYSFFSDYLQPVTLLTPGKTQVVVTLRVLALRRSDKRLTLETSALKSLYGGQITLSTLLIKPNIVATAHRRSATLSLETNILIFWVNPVMNQYPTRVGEVVTVMFEVFHTIPQKLDLCTRNSEYPVGSFA